ncbi:unnamed protein product [Meganyctiphanes norvegica]|uniref:Uncharacterized protein n=1 Tax=Meganyctiphanes norvegica TaxID=48144 RepID=A0AAV2S3N9_MEGNR
MSYVIKSSIQSQPSKVEIITVPSTLKASVAAQKPPKGFVVVERDSAKGHGHTNDKFKEVRPIKVPGSLLPQVIPEDIEQIERKERKQDKENLKQAKSVSKNISNKQHMVTQDGILTLKGIIKDYQKVYNPNIYLPSNSNKQNYQREKYKYVPGSNLFPLGNITTPREYSFSPTLSTESEDITSSDTFDELTRGRTFSSKDYKVTLSEVSDSESELISYNNFSHNASEKENIFHENVMSHKMPKNKDNDSPSCIMTEDGITLPLSSSKKNPTQSSVKKVVTFSDPPEMQSTIDETNIGIVPVKQGYLRVRERPHSSILTDKDRNKKINSHTYQRLVNPYSRLAKNKPSGICNRAVKQGLLENIQGIPKNKKSSQRYDSSQKKVSQEKEKHPPDKG